MNSILDSIKKLLGIDSTYQYFDADLIMHINTVFMGLYQMGIGPAQCFSISDSSSTWDEFIGDGVADLEAVKTYMYLKVKSVFDPPSSGAAESLNRMMEECEWRLYVSRDTNGGFLP